MVCGETIEEACFGGGMNLGAWGEMTVALGAVSSAVFTATLQQPLSSTCTNTNFGWN